MDFWSAVETSVVINVISGSGLAKELRGAWSRVVLRCRWRPSNRLSETEQISVASAEDARIDDF